MAIATIGMPLGTALYIPLLQAIIDGFDWRLAWVVSGLLVLILAVPACAFLMRKDPESMGLTTDGGDNAADAKRELAAPGKLAARRPHSRHSTAGGVSSPDAADAADAADAERKLAAPGKLAANRPHNQYSNQQDWTLKQAVRSGAFWRLLGYVGLSGLMIQGALVYRTSFWEDIDISSSQIALGTSVDPLTVVFSGLFFGLMAERIKVRYIGWIGLTGIACSMIPLFLAQNSFLVLLSHYFIWGLSWVPTSPPTTSSGPTTSAGAISVRFAASCFRSQSEQPPSARRSSPSSPALSTR